MSEQYSIDLQRKKLELVGTLWLNQLCLRIPHS